MFFFTLECNLQIDYCTTFLRLTTGALDSVKRNINRLASLTKIVLTIVSAFNLLTTKNKKNGIVMSKENPLACRTSFVIWHELKK